MTTSSVLGVSSDNKKEAMKENMFYAKQNKKNALTNVVNKEKTKKVKKLQMKKSC